VREVAEGRSVVDSRIAAGWSNGAISEQLVITKRAPSNDTSLDLSKPGLGESEHVSWCVKAPCCSSRQAR
jgi:hypothetical protein